jgi:phospholipid/cholesterol/gamma-HCH transport system substrate-binding protein
MQGAAKVGLLVLVFVALLYGAYSILGQSFGKADTRDYFAEFADAGGVVEGTKVLMAGVKVGTVRRVELKNPRLARLTMAIDADKAIPTGSQAVIPTALIGFGDNPVQIVPPAETTTLLQPGATLVGVRGGALDNILPNSKETLNEVNKTLIATRKLIENTDLQKKMTRLLDTTNTTLTEFSKLAGNANTMLAQSSPSIQNALRDASLTMAEIRKGTAMVTKLLEKGDFQKEALALLDKLNSSAAKANKLIDNINAYVADPELKQSMKSVAANAASASESATRIAATGEKIAVNAEKITANGIVMSEKAIEIETKASDLLEDVKKAVNNITGFFNKGGGKPSIPRIAASMDLLRETEPNHWRTDLGAKIALPDSNLHLGIFDAFESNKLTVQLGKPFGKGNEYRYGIYASKPGVGVDFRVAPRLFLRGDVFDINNPRFDLRAGYEFGNNFVGWIGVEKIFDRNAATIGVGFRK